MTRRLYVPSDGPQSWRARLRTRILSTEEIGKVLEACPTDLRLVARTTLESLLRLSEVLNLRREDVGPTLCDHRPDQEWQDAPGPDHRRTARGVNQAVALFRVCLRPRRRRESPDSAFCIGGVRTLDEEDRPEGRQPSRSTSYGRIGVVHRRAIILGCPPGDESRRGPTLALARTTVTPSSASRTRVHHEDTGRAMREMASTAAARAYRGPTAREVEWRVADGRRAAGRSTRVHIQSTYPCHLFAESRRVCT